MREHARQVYESLHFEIWVDEPARLVICVRTEMAFETMVEMHAAFGQLIRTLDALGRSRYVLLCDLRRAHGRNDPVFEEAMSHIRPRWLGGFRRVAVHVKGVLGAMQIKRYARDDGIERLISSDENELEAYLKGAP